MAHSHHHGHDHTHNANQKVLSLSFIVICSYMIVEVIGGLLTNSLALLADAGHMLSDAAALGLSLLAFKFGEKKATETKTFGYKRFEILAALINGLALIVIAGYIFWEAWHRFLNPPQVAGTGMLIVATIGLFVNIFVAWLLMRGDTKENLNIRSAFLHVLGDLLGSIGAITAAILMMLFNWTIADPMASVIVAILVLISGWRVTKDALHVLMEGKPAHIDLEQVKEKLLGIHGVRGIHDLHVWTITSDFPSLSCHLTVAADVDKDYILKQATTLLQEEFQMKHTTIQIEGEHSGLQEEEDYCH